MKSYIDLYIRHLEAECKSPETLAQYSRQLKLLVNWLRIQYNLDLSQTCLPHITGIMLTEYYQSFHERRLAISTRNNYVVIIKEFFEFLVSAGAIERDPSAVLRCVKEKESPENSEEHMYTPEDVQVLLHSMVSDKPRRNCARDTAAVALILATGLRASEICNLNGAQIAGIRNGSLYCKRKGSNWKTVAVGSFCIPYLDDYLLLRGQPAPDEPLFVSQKGHRLTRNALWKSLATKQRRAELSTGVHILRHTMLSAIDHDGGSALARDVGGHASVAVTNRYIHTSPEDRKRAVNNTAFAKLMSGAQGGLPPSPGQKSPK